MRQYDWVFAAVLSVGLRIASGNCKNKDIAKSGCFFWFFRFFKMSGANVTSFLWNWCQLQKSLGTYGLKCWLRGSFLFSTYVQFADNYSLCIMSFEQKITWITCNPFCYFENTIINNALWHVFLCRGQARNKLGTPEGAKKFVRGAQIFWTMSNSFKLYATHFSRGWRKIF